MAKKTLTVRNMMLGDGIPKICVPITAGTMEEMKAQVQKILDAPCDMVEWRADFFQETAGETWLLDALVFLRKSLKEIPLLFTFRTKEEGGERRIPMEEYARLNASAAATGLIDLADVELNRGEELLCSITQRLHVYGVRVIGSFHDFGGTPAKEEIVDVLCRMQKCGVDITKAAVMPRTEEDVLTLLEASLQMKKQYSDRPFITMSMGSQGAVSRLAGSLTGSSVTFATAGRASAPGQMEAEALARLLPAMNVEICR
ncbi:MAG: type I 3-dehydroquinate dehydratase [Lachnospiraceae bacterium]|nr:type I 3-dehydroquinate dehydratase [Lachnospiraceae bacterium]